MNHSFEMNKAYNNNNKLIIMYNKLTSSKQLNSNSSFINRGLSLCMSVVIVVSSVIFLVNLGRLTVVPSGRVMLSIFSISN